MKLLIENWRKFLNEQNSALNDVALAKFKTSSGAGFVLYRLYFNPAAKSNVLSIIGAVTVGKTLQPCIPETMQIDSIYVNEPYRRMGFGSLLYDFAFLYAAANKVGLTSDKIVGTQKKAASKWDKINKSSSYEKRKTDQGNDTFDYTGRETPLDPNDDCNEPAVPEKNASDFSFTKKNAGDVMPKFKEMSNIHKQNVQKAIDLGMFRSQKALERHLRIESDIEFERNYMDEPE
jgi:GNAT superfamily N-acetyltransferase